MKKLVTHLSQKEYFKIIWNYCEEVFLSDNGVPTLLSSARKCIFWWIDRLFSKSCGVLGFTFGLSVEKVAVEHRGICVRNQVIKLTCMYFMYIYIILYISSVKTIGKTKYKFSTWQPIFQQFFESHFILILPCTTYGYIFQKN